MGISTTELLRQGLDAVASMKYKDSYIFIKIPWYLRPFRSKIRMMLLEAWAKGQKDARESMNEELI